MTGVAVETAVDDVGSAIVAIGGTLALVVIPTAFRLDDDATG